MASRTTLQPAQAGPKSPFFQQQRDALVGEIAISLENVLQSMNKLNRSLEGVIAVGNEFGAVEALWSQFEGVMAQETEGEGEGETDGSGGEDGGVESVGEAEEVDEKGRGR